MFHGNVVTMPQRQNISQTILQQLSNWGVKTIYGYAGDSILSFLAAIAEQNNIKFVSTKNEEAAALMASAEAKLTGNMAVCLAHAGPGCAHLINGLADAYLDRVPVLAITGQVESEFIGTDHKQYIDQQGLFKSVTSYTNLITSPLSLVNTLNKAIKTAISQKTVSHISIPKDYFILESVEPPRPAEPYLTTAPISSPDVINGAISKLNQAQRPVIIIGRGAWGQTEAVQQLSEKWGAAVVNTLAGTGVVPHQFPFAVGGFGLAGTGAAKEVLNNADMVLRLGATWWPEKYVHRELRIVQVDSEPASIGSPVPVEYGVVGQVSDILPTLINGINPTMRSNWRQYIEDQKLQWQQLINQETAVKPGEPITPPMVMKAIQDSIYDNALIALDTGNHSVWFGRDFQASHQNVLLSGKWRTMGFGLPAANSAAINQPGRQVVAIVGDGCLNMQLAELTTTAQLNQPITIVVLKNNMLGMEKGRMHVAEMPQLGVDLYNPDFTSVAEACGIKAWQINDSALLYDAVHQAMASNKPSLVEVSVHELIPPGLTM